MNRLLLILILTFSFQNLTKADDFKDFEIEGISIGDSALDFFSKSILEKQKKLEWHDTKNFIPITDLVLKNSKIYDSIQLAVITNTKYYKIASVQGIIFYQTNINKCYEEMDSIALKIKDLFSNIEEVEKSTHKHSSDKSGKSSVTSILFLDTEGNEISIQCYDWSNDKPYWDQLRITLDNKEYSYFIRYEAYK
ncbi:hypothetical protein ABXT63_03460 [Candidatus Pelagibacter sp. Uisw_092]|uniref:hypothetical protein n=1 Tax=Candidatus Pelagibacter sp. Uisw_092 TaxID=3230979 RepID=UPI0039ECB506